jgi:hypothetical protein
VVVVFAAAVSVLRVVAAQYAQLAVLPAWELAPERGVPQAVQPVAQADPQVAQSVPCELLAVRSVALPADPLAAHLALDELLAVHSAPDELLAVRSVALPADPLAAHLALDELLAVHLVPCELSAVHLVALQSDPLADC